MTAAIEAKGLTVRRGGRTVLSGLDLRVGPGTVLGIAGPNGAGKSTLLDALCGFLPYDGSVRIAGAEVGADLMAARRRVSAAVPPRGAALALTGARYLAFVGAAEGYAAPTPAQSDLAARTEMTEALGRPIRTYSHGMLKKLSVLASLREGAAAHVLDESLNGMDVLAGRAMRAAFSQRAATGAAVVVCSHDLPLLHAWCDTVVVVASGRIARAWDKAALRDQPYGTFEDQVAMLYEGKL